MANAVRKLVHRELMQVGIKAQDLIENEDSFARVNTELNRAWDLCRANDLEGAAEIGMRQRIETDRIIQDEARTARKRD